MGFLPGMLTRMSDGMAAPVGILKITVGTPPFMDMPQAVDIKLFIVDEHKRVFEASKNMSVRQDGIIGIIDVPFPIRPYEKEFICRAWVTAAYFKGGDTWINNNASAYESKNKRFIERKLSKIK
ncbi:MAG TPA: hypothetical protein DEQ02_07880 [Ruminococcaceae bacterium]|nr:hypothetical protein [Oscillospiraceae bacterium]